MAEMSTKSTEVVQPEGNYYDKYHSTNPIVKWMMKGFKDAISELLDIAGKEFCQICETGCGEGEITSFIKDMYQNAEIDISEKVIAEASEKIHGINFYTGNIYTMEVRKPGEAEKHILNKGRYWKDLGNTPGHIQHWTKKKFCRMVVNNDMKIVSVKTPFPWTMVLARKG